LPLIGGGRQEGAWETGDVDSAPLPVGQSIGLINRVMTCEEIITSIVKEAGEILTTVQRRFV